MGDAQRRRFDSVTDGDLIKVDHEICVCDRNQSIPADTIGQRKTPMENLIATELSHKPVIAVPSYRVRAHFGAAFDHPAMRAGLGTLVDGFLASYQNNLEILTLQKASASSKVKQTKMTSKKLSDLRKECAAGFLTYRAFRFSGADGTTPALPAMSAHHYPVPRALEDKMAPFSTLILDLPFDTGGELVELSHQVLRSMPVIAATAGFGFSFCDPSSFAYRLLPPAHLRYRCALMADDPPASKLVRYDTAWVKMRRLDQRRKSSNIDIPNDDLYDYTPGLPDIGWRTYIGEAFRTRLPDQPDASFFGHGATLEILDTMSIVTAGSAPIWGDLNTVEDISAYQAAAAYLAPAMADHGLRVREAPCYTKSDPEKVRAAEAYVNRFDIKAAGV